VVHALTVEVLNQVQDDDWLGPILLSAADPSPQQQNRQHTVAPRPPPPAL